MKETLHIYTRVSTSIQEDDGTSLETQKGLGVERSKNLGMKNRVWNEGSRSSSHDDLSNRPVLTELLQEVQDGRVKHLYVWNTDRLSRNIQTWGLIRLLLIKNDVHLHTPTGELILTDPQTNLMLGIMSEFSQYDNLLRTERFRLGKLVRIREGGWKGGPPPYGYMLEDGLLVVNSDESKWVVKIHEWYRDSYTPEQIKDELLKNGVITRRGNPVWSLGSINALLRNTHYDGYWYYTDKKSETSIRVPCPRICTPELIQTVKKAWEKRRYGKGKGRAERAKTSVTKHTYLLSKLIKCGVCGSFYYGNKKTTLTKHGTPMTSYYHCGSKTNKYRDKHTDNMVVCGSKRNVRIDTTEQVVWDLVKEIVGSSHLYKEQIKNSVLGAKETHKDTERDKVKLQKRVDKISKEVQKITDTIVDLTTQNLLAEGRDLKQVIKRLEDTRNEREAEIHSTASNLQQIDTQNRWVNWLKEWKDSLRDLDSLNPEERHQFIQKVVSEVVIHEIDKQKHRLEVTFQFPWVGDKLIYNDPGKKSKGYRIKNGRKTKSKKVDLLKKYAMIEV
jgi:site-specific DNA recombinase